MTAYTISSEVWKRRRIVEYRKYKAIFHAILPPEPPSAPLATTTRPGPPHGGDEGELGAAGEARVCVGDGALLVLSAGGREALVGRQGEPLEQYRGALCHAICLGAVLDPAGAYETPSSRCTPMKRSQDGTARSIPVKKVC